MIAFLLIGNFVSACLALGIAGNKNRNAAGWAFACYAVPLVGLLALACMRSLPARVYS